MKTISLFFRNKMFLSVIPLLSILNGGFAQNPSVKVFEDWNTTSGTQNDFQRSVVRSKSFSGSTYYYLCGATLNSSGNYDILVEKKNASGTVLWAQTYNGAGNGNDYAADVQIDNAGNVYVCGTYYKDATDSNNAVIIKYNTAGTHKWTKTYNGAGSRHDIFTALQVAGNVVVAVGTTWKDTTDKYDILAIRVDSSSNTVWTQTWDYLNLNDGAVNLWNSGTKVYIAGGAQSAATTYKYAVLEVKLSDGSIQASTVTGGTAFGIDQVTDIQMDQSGHIFVTGGVLNTGTLYDIKTVKLDTTLTILWSQTYASSGAYNDMGTGLAIDQVGNVIVTGYRTTPTTGKDYVTIKYSSGGTQRWASTFDGGETREDSATCIVVSPTDTNKIYVSGYSYHRSSKDYWTIKYDGLGNQKWDIGFNHVEDGDDRAFDIALDTIGNVIVQGQNKLNDTTYEFSTVKYIEKSVTMPQDTISFTYTNYQFTKNRGQVIHLDSTAADEVKYYTIFGSPQMYFTDSSVSYVLTRDDTTASDDDSIARVDMKFVDANADARIRSMDVRENYYNFFKPQCEEGLGTVPNYDRLVSFDVWNNVDIMYASNLKGLKYYFVCKPTGGGSSSSQIDLYYEGADSVKISGTGQLIIYTPLGTIIQPKAAAWQLDANGNYQSLGWQPSYVILGTNEVGFTSFGTFNTSLPLVIAVDWGNKTLSPTTDWFTNNVWSTYLEGDQFVDNGLGSTTTSTGSLVITGTTMSANFPTSSGAFSTSFWGMQEVFVTRFTAANNIDWSTFIGGYADEVGYDVFEESTGNLMLFGNTASDNFPMSVPTGYQDATNVFGDYTYYLFELTATGNINLWSTYFGGNDGEFVNWGRQLEVDAAGNIYIGGMTKSDNVTEGFPITPLTGAYNQGTHAGGVADGFVAKFNTARQLVWCTYFGGNGYDDLTGIDVEDDEVFITGYTNTASTNTTCAGNTSGGFPICNGGYYQSAHQGVNDAYVARFDVNGALVWSTFFGGSGDETFTTLVVSGKRVFVVGSTTTTTGQTTANQCNPTTNGDFPTCDPGGSATFVNSNAGGSDLFIAIFDAIDNSLLWSTFYGGTGSETPNDIAADATGNLFIVGHVTGSLGSAAVDQGNNYYWQQNNADASGTTTDGLLVKVNLANTVTWAIHYGGYTANLSTYNPEQIGSLALYQSSALYITGVAGTLNFPYRCDPATAYCWQESNSSYLQSAFAAKFDLTGGVGIEESSPAQGAFTVYPNPASDQLTISLADNIEEGTTFNIYNSVEQVVYTLNLSPQDQNRNFSIDIQFLATGLYVARLESPTSYATQKFIKE